MPRTVPGASDDADVDLAILYLETSSPLAPLAKHRTTLKTLIALLDDAGERGRAERLSRYVRSHRAPEQIPELLAAAQFTVANRSLSLAPNDVAMTVRRISEYVREALDALHHVSHHAA